MHNAVHAALECVVNWLDAGFGKVGMLAPLGVTGGTPSPDIDLVIYLIGKEACMRQLDELLEFIRARV